MSFYAFSSVMNGFVMCGNVCLSFNFATVAHLEAEIMYEWCLCGGHFEKHNGGYFHFLKKKKTSIFQKNFFEH